MKVLVLASHVPATPGMAGSPRLFSLCRGLAARHDLTLAIVGPDQGRYDALRADPLAAGVFRDIVSFPRGPEPRWWGRQVHRIRQAPHFVTRYRTPEFHAETAAKLRELYRRGSFDVIFADGLWVAQYVQDARLECPAIIDLHDSMTLLYVRTRQMETNWRRRLSLFAETRSIAHAEASLQRTFDAVVTNSPVDEAYLKRLNPRTRTRTIGNGVDTAYFAPGNGTVDRSRILFTGVMSYGPNEDAAIHFATAVLPLIRRQHPQVEFWIVGKDPGERVVQLRELAGVHVTGGVPDVRPYLREAGVFVSPLRYGTGIKNKVLAALSMRKPTVATTWSIEGLALRPGQDLLIADEPGEFAACVGRLLDDPATAGQLGASGEAFVRAHYTWERSADALGLALEEAVARHGAADASGRSR
jgi:glycosyltransferase involved in cell wall biosynthesis